jgi:glycosyltransferase involved in cell wall biosynthesis
MSSKPKISVVCGAFNEEANVLELYERIVGAFKDLDYLFEIIVIDNASTDRTVEHLRDIASEDKRLKVIVNATNFGHVRSPYYALLQAQGDAVVFMASDLQDPPELIPEYLKKWESGSKIVLAVKTQSSENWVMKSLRSFYYKLLSLVSNESMVPNATGAGLFDQRVIRTLRALEDPLPYFRGLVTQLGFKVDTLEFHQPARKGGTTKNNFATLFDLALLGFVNYSKAPLRLLTAAGFVTSLVSVGIAFTYFILKLLYWDSFDLGLAPLVIGVFFFGATQLFALGLIGELLVSVQQRVRKMPLVIESERINFDEDKQY